MSIAPEEQTPLIWTAAGNLPIADLVLTMERTDEVDQIVICEVYCLKSTGQEVKRSVHVLPLAPWQTGKGGRLETMGATGEVANIE